MPTRLTTSAGQMSLEYRPTFYFKVQGAYVKLTDHAVIVYRRNGIDYWTSEGKDKLYYDCQKAICFEHGVSIGESLWMDKAAWVIEMINHLTTKH